MTPNKLSTVTRMSILHALKTNIGLNLPWTKTRAYVLLIQVLKRAISIPNSPKSLTSEQEFFSNRSVVGKTGSALLNDVDIQTERAKITRADIL